VRYMWIVAVFAGLFLCWVAYHGARRTPETPDRLVVTYVFHDSQGRAQSVSENVAVGAQAARWLEILQTADEYDIGKRKCPMNIRLDFYQGVTRTCSFAVTGDGCNTVKLLEGSCPSAGRSGYFAVRLAQLRPFIQRQQALARMAPDRTAELAHR
jgi:hypothetical protein